MPRASKYTSYYSNLLCFAIKADVLTDLPCTNWTHSCQSEQDKWAFLLHYQRLLRISQNAPLDTWILTKYHFNFLQDLYVVEGETIFNQRMGQMKIWRSKESRLWFTNLNVTSLLAPMLLPSGLDGTSMYHVQGVISLPKIAWVRNAQLSTFQIQHDCYILGSKCNKNAIILHFYINCIYLLTFRST